VRGTAYRDSQIEDPLTWLSPSNGQSHRSVPEEHRNHEKHKSTCQTTSIERNNARDGYGDDKSTPRLHSISLTCRGAKSEIT
jgi:hypothetical protein